MIHGSTGLGVAKQFLKKLWRPLRRFRVGCEDGSWRAVFLSERFMGQELAWGGLWRPPASWSAAAFRRFCNRDRPKRTAQTARDNTAPGVQLALLQLMMAARAAAVSSMAGR
jgi:hypothetical protein